MAKLLYLITALCAIDAALAIKCYECDSSKGVTCSIGLLSFTQTVKDCDEGGNGLGILNSFVPKNCYKLTAKDKDDNEYVARGCGVNVGFNACDVVARTVGFMSSHEGGVKDLRCDECDTDKCNGAAGLGPAALLAVLAACFLFFF